MYLSLWVSLTVQFSGSTDAEGSILCLFGRQFKFVGGPGGRRQTGCAMWKKAAAKADPHM